MKKLILFILICTAGLSASAQYNYLGTYNADGVPDYLVGRDVVSDQLLANINASLPESQPVPTYNPHLIMSGYDTDLILLDNADIWVTFVQEGAGYKNVLGFYTYDLANPYTSAPPASEITIVFPNVSAKWSGGGLETGDKVKIGNFPANTGIGWVLIADGWNGSAVDAGNWILYSNPNFNPEPLEEERYHSVLLNDEENGLIVLGIEDIRRDYGSCDQDFNDAIFYVTANPITAIQRSNVATIVEAEPVTSGNDGGLESNGDLSSAIAKRSFSRNKYASANNTKHRQVEYAKTQLANRAAVNSFAAYFPSTGFTGKEEMLESSPQDLIELTNAKEVFAADYYLGEDRVAAVLLTETHGEVYNHNKHICDRLNGSKLESARTVLINGIQYNFVTIERNEGETEYATWVSLKKIGANYEALSLWNIDDYPVGDYLNLQVWGSTPSQVFNLLDKFIQTIASSSKITKAEINSKIPGVFVKSGTYKNGILMLNLANPSAAESIQFTSSFSRTEFSEKEEIIYQLALSGEAEESIEIEIGQIFDTGISIYAEGEEGHDALYLADGAWGIDYRTERTVINTFEVSLNDHLKLENGYLVERNFSVTGESEDVINVFRNLKAGNKALDVSEYVTLGFDLQSDVAIEISLIEDNLKDWDNRLTYQLPSTGSSRQRRAIALSDFTRQGESNQQISPIQSIVFAYIHKSGARREVNYSASHIFFGSESVVTSNIPIMDNLPSVKVYPNPNAGMLNVKVEGEQRLHKIEVYNLAGKQVYHKESYGQEEQLQLDLAPGLYNVFIHSNRMVHQSKIVIK